MLRRRIGKLQQSLTDSFGGAIRVSFLQANEFVDELTGPRFIPGTRNRGNQTHERLDVFLLAAIKIQIRMSRRVATPVFEPLRKPSSVRDRIDNVQFPIMIE